MMTGLFPRAGIVCILAVLMGLSSRAATQNAGGGIWAAAKKAKSDGVITVCEDLVTGRISPQNGVCGAPEQPGTPNFAAWKAAEFPFSRTHDLNLIPGYGGPYVIDVPWIFRDFDADENDPKNYDFTCTDDLLRRIREVGTEPFYRLGCAWEGVLVVHYTNNDNLYKPKRVTLRRKSGASLAQAVCHLTDRTYIYTQYDPEPNEDGSIDLMLMPNAFVYVEAQ